MSQHCRANPCCGDRPCSGVPIPQDKSGYWQRNPPEAPETEMDRLLKEEAAMRKVLNDMQAERDRLDERCKLALESLNDLKRQAYALGFKGNIMRDADGNRVNKL